MKTRIILAMLAMFLVSCAPVVTPTPTGTPVQPTATLVPLTPTSLVPKPTPIDAPIAPNADQQIYHDPDGWFSLNLPAAWKTQSANAFSGENGFFEARYLPEMMFMQQPVNVCQWLANIDSKATYSVALNFDNPVGPWSGLPDPCTLTTLPGISPATVQLIIENPQADYEHRFLSLKADAEHFFQIESTFFWSRRIGAGQKSILPAPPLRPADASFWENTTPLFTKFTIREYALFPDGTYSPFERTFLEYIPAEAPRVSSQKENEVSIADNRDSVDEQLKIHGYELKTDPTRKTYPQLYKDGSLLLDKVANIHTVYTFSTSVKPIMAFAVQTADSMCYLVQNATLLEWGSCFNDPRLAPILHKGELLWVRAAENSHIQVQTSQQEIVYSFASYNLVGLPINRFRSWNNHWILEIDKYFDGFLVEDGEILNEKFGFEEAFGWQLVNDKPFYFFRKGPRVGISYDGKFLPLDYDQIAHGFFNDPIGDGSKVPFFGRRDGTWYYVILEGK